ncbi:MAG: hypothetical protein H6811_07575 [Phycisphaeraceae bacterium]|nr:hypothetical protein [Phycisphaeraceae bacterium]
MTRGWIAAIVGVGSWLGASAPGAEPPEDSPLPSLDELLGLEEAPLSDTEEGSGAGRTLPLDEAAQRELDRQLSGEQVGELFHQTVQLMGDAADRLELARDTGIATQRVQEDILRKLDQLIEAASQGQSQSQSRQQQQQQDAQNQAQQQQQNQPQNSQVQQAHEPPTLQGTQMTPGQAPDMASWGSLPERLRAALTQGTSDPVSVMYRALTESYYRRLAEQGSRP